MSRNSVTSSVRTRAERIKNRRWHDIYDRMAPYTMMPRGAYVQKLKLASAAEASNGCVVECGTWRGGMIAGMAATLGPLREYVLFDSFEGLPPAQEVDGERALAWQEDRTSASYFDNCRAEQSEALAAMQLAGIAAPEIIPGWFDTTVPKWSESERPIAMVHLDGDWFESIMVCLRHLFPLVVSGGIVIIDDYGNWDGCTKAVHRYLTECGRAEPIRSTSEGVTYIRKQ